jgi:hypothetical protein
LALVERLHVDRRNDPPLMPDSPVDHPVLNMSSEPEPSIKKNLWTWSSIGISGNG